MQKLEQYRLQQKLFQEGSEEDEDEQPWEEDDEESNVSWQPRGEPRKKKHVVPEMEEEANDEEYRIVKDNQLWEKQDETREEGEDIGNEEESQIDGTVEKGLGPTDTLIWTGNLYKFRPHTMEILKTNEQKADWQDKDQTIALVKTWLKENRKPISSELN